MAMFRITVGKADGSTETRTIEAESRDAAVARIAAEGVDVLDAAAASPSLVGRLAAFRVAFPRRSAWGPVPRGYRLAAAALIALPLAAALGATLLAARIERQVARLAQEQAARPPVADRAGVSAAMAREPVSVTIARVARRLPADAALHAAARDRNGALTLEIDAVDPEAIRAALSADPALAGLATAGETMVPDRGLRMRLTDAR